MFRTRQEQDSKGPCQIHYLHLPCEGEWACKHSKHSQKSLACSKTKNSTCSKADTVSYLCKSYPGSSWMEPGAWRRHLLPLTFCHQMAAAVGGGEDYFLLSLSPLISSGSCGYSLMLLLLLSHLWSLVNPGKMTAVSSMSFHTIKGAWESVPNCGLEEAVLNKLATPSFFLPFRRGRYQITFHFKPSGKSHIFYFKYMTLKVIGQEASGTALAAA